MNEILIYSDIGESMWWDSVSAKDVRAQLDQMSGDVTVRINSPGGDVFDGFAIHNMLASHPGKITVHVDALAASAASVIAMAGDDIIMADNALMMIHDPWTVSVGSAQEMRDTADLLDKIRDSIVTTYVGQTAGDENEIAEQMAAETWLSATEAVEQGFATAVDTGKQSAAPADMANMVKPWIKNTPTAEQVSPNSDDQAAWRVALNRRRLSMIDSGSSPTAGAVAPAQKQ